MNTYRKNAVMTGILYFLGTAFGVSGGLIGGKVLSLGYFRRTARRCGYAEPRSCRFVPNYMGCLY